MGGETTPSKNPKQKQRVGGSPPLNSLLITKCRFSTIKTEKIIMATIKLVDEQVDEISVIDSNNKYKPTTQKGKDGKTFSRFRYDGVIFTVDNDSPFVQACNDGNVASVKLISGEREIPYVDSDGNEQTNLVPTLTFDSFTSFTQAERRAEHKAKIARYNVIATAPVTDSLIAELMA